MILFEGEWVVVYEFSLFVAKIEVYFRVSCILRNQSTLRNLNTPRLIPFHQWTKNPFARRSLWIFKDFWGLCNFFKKYTFRNTAGLFRNSIMFIISTRHLTNHQKVNFKKTLWNHRAHTCKFTIPRRVSYSPWTRSPDSSSDQIIGPASRRSFGAGSMNLFRVNLEL